MDSNNNKKIQNRKKSGGRKSKGSNQSIQLADSPYKFRGIFSDPSNRGKTIWAIKFNPFSQRNAFAVAACQKLILFECQGNNDAEDKYSAEGNEQNNTGIIFLSEYEDQDDFFYAIAWSSIEQGKSILCGGGKKGVIRVIHTVRDKKFQLIGHTGAINDLKVHPTNRAVLLSASEDHSLKLWNIKSQFCIATFAGEVHKSQVLTATFNREGTFFASGSMDKAIAIWKIDTEEIQKAITDSNKRNNPIRIYEQNFLTYDIHNNYVDSILWFGDNSFISRSQDGDIVWWKTGKIGDAELQLDNNKATKLYVFKENDPENNRVWFLRLEIDPFARYLCVGDIYGKILMYDIESKSLQETKTLTVSHRKSTLLPRMIGFSRDAKIMVTCSENGLVIRWDKRQNTGE